MTENSDLLNTSVSDLNNGNAVNEYLQQQNRSKPKTDFSKLRDMVRGLFDGKKATPERMGEKSFRYQNPVLEKYYDNLNRQEKKLHKGEMIDSDNLMSERFFFKDEGPGERTFKAKGHGKETAGWEGLFTHRQMEKAGEPMGGKDVGVADIASTAIHRVRYNPETKNLYVTYVGGDKEYLFPGVPEDVVRKFLNASSKGRFAHSRIKPYGVSKSEALKIRAKSKDK